MVDRLTFQGQQFGVAVETMYVDRMTIRRQASVKGPAGGNIPGDPLILATDVPCRLRPANAVERELVGATQGMNTLVVKAPAWQGSELIEIDSRCEIVIAARDGGVPEQTLKAVAPLPNQGISIEIVATRTV